MTQPTNYTPTTDFSQQESINASGRSTVNTSALDAEFANIETTLDQTVSNLSLIQRDDGRLKDVSVEIHTISPEVLNLIGGGYALRGLWAEATVYAPNDLCSNGAYTYVCSTSHTASGLFDGQYWTQFGFTSGADAAQAAAAAQGSATSAASSATAAGNSAIAAAASASSISGSVASASSYASIATTKAGDAASSATAASNSAIAAAALAGSIDVSTFAPKTGVGATGTWPISISGESATSSACYGNSATASLCTGNSATSSQSSGLLVPGPVSFGYSAGAGGAVTQATAKNTGVTLHKPTGQIIMHNAALAAGAKVFFDLNNSLITVNDVVMVTIKQGSSATAYRAWVGQVSSGLCFIGVENISAGSLSDAVSLNFTIIKGASA